MAGRRLGVWTLHKVARQMCKYIVQFTPLIRNAYPENTAILVALEAANIACAALEAELDPLLEIGT